MLLELIKLLKAMKKKGFASSAEKAKVKELFAKLKSEDQEAVQDDVQESEKLETREEGDPSDEELNKSVKSLFAAAKGEIVDEVSERVKSFLEQDAELRAKKSGIYHPQIQEKRKSLNEALFNILKVFGTNDVEKMKEMTTDASGSPYAGYVVDTELSAEIRHLITQYGVARREMTSIALTKHDYKANNLATDVTVYWVDEASTIGSTQVVLGQEDLSLKKLGAIVTFTNELLQDSEIDFMSFVGSRVAEAFARKEDEAFFKGDGTSTYGGFTGLLKNTDIADVEITSDSIEDVNADDLLDMQDALHSGALANAKYYYHRTIKSIIRKLKDNQGAYIYQAPSVSGPATVWGYPEVLVEAMPKKSDDAPETAFILFGDLRKSSIHGYKNTGLEISTFDAGVVRNVANNADINLITTDRRAIRFTERTGAMTILPAAVVRLKTAEASN